MSDALEEFFLHSSRTFQQTNAIGLPLQQVQTVALFNAYRSFPWLAFPSSLTSFSAVFCYTCLPWLLCLFPSGFRHMLYLRFPLIKLYKNTIVKEFAAACHWCAFSVQVPTVNNILNCNRVRDFLCPFSDRLCVCVCLQGRGNWRWNVYPSGSRGW